MTTDEIREKYIRFFENLGHKKIEPAPLVLENDPTTLFTSAGMQPLTPYLKGEPHPKGKRLVDIQPSLRTVDIDEIGDNRHLTFFEMLGNWSLGDYFKKEQLEWCLEFFTKELGLPKEKLWVSVFEGTKEVPKDNESFERWKELGIPENRIFFYGVDKNWWSRSGEPDKMPAGEIGGPDSEVFFDFGTAHNSKYGEKCHPNCACGRFLEIGNSVFIQYQKNDDGTLSELSQKNVDFGGGLERIAAAVTGKQDVYKTDLFEPVMDKFGEEYHLKYGESEERDKSFRIVADHLRASVMLIAEGVLPGNKLQGYVLRRLIRRSVFHIQKWVLQIGRKHFSSVAEPFKDIYPSLREKWATISEVLDAEYERFDKSLQSGKVRLTRALNDGTKIDGKFAFHLYQTEGFPLELTLEILSKEGKKFSGKEKKMFEKEFEKHQEKSRTASAGRFKGGLADSSEQVTRLHTATHLLHAALRKVLGEGMAQKGSNITAERLRFDFSHPQKLTDEEIKKVEDLINEQIKKDLPVSFETMTLDEAVKKGALHFFGERYGKEVRVYTVGDSSISSRPPFSREVCGGPHVKHLGELGHVKIMKQEKIGAGIVRIYAAI